MAYRGLWIAFGLAVGTAGCQIPDPANGDIDRLVPVLCEAAQGCFCAADAEAESCEIGRRDKWMARAEEGRSRGLGYDPECLEAQLERADGYSCRTASEAGDDQHLCEEFCAVFFGDREEGESCEAFDEVVSDCGPTLTCSDGTCRRPCEALTGLSEGSRCASDEGLDFERCADGLSCNYTTQRCARAPEVGESCPEYECSGDAYCDDSRICRTRPEEGESCDFSPCATGLFCDWDEQSDRQVCREYVEEGDNCVEKRCAPGLGCNGQTCQAPADEGEACGEIGCAEGLRCDGVLGRCVAPPTGEGQPCPFGECGGKLWCDTSQDPEGQCLPRVETGERCSGHDQCNSAYCPAGFCVTRPAEGEDCRGTNICQGGLVCVDDVCVPSVAEGPAICAYRGW